MYQSLIANDPSLCIQLEYLAKTTKSVGFLLKDEGEAALIKCIILSSAKVRVCVCVCVCVFYARACILKHLYDSETRKKKLFFLQQQYIITRAMPDVKLPNQNKDSEVMTKKVKGLPRSRHSNVSFLDFSNITIENKPTRSVVTASLKKTKFRIYLIKSRKKLLSRFSTKRLFSEKYKTNNSFFSFPLNWKGVLIK